MMTPLYSEPIPVTEITSDWRKFHFPRDSRVITCVNLNLVMTSCSFASCVLASCSLWVLWSWRLGSWACYAELTRRWRMACVQAKLRIRKPRNIRTALENNNDRSRLPAAVF